MRSKKIEEIDIKLVEIMKQAQEEIGKVMEESEEDDEFRKTTEFSMLLIFTGPESDKARCGIVGNAQNLHDATIDAATFENGAGLFLRQIGVRGEGFEGMLKEMMKQLDT